MLAILTEDNREQARGYAESKTMLDLFDEIIRRCAAGERIALCTVVDARGSTPQQRGARMIVTTAGGIMGTLGRRLCRSRSAPARDDDAANR